MVQVAQTNGGFDGFLPPRVNLPSAQQQFADLAAKSNKQEPKYFKVKATREGLVGQKTSNGHIIKENDHFVALPDRSALNKKVELRNGKFSLITSVLDIGPWNIHDPYWKTGTRPQAETGTDLFKRKTNGAGIDLADGIFRDLACVPSSGVGSPAWPGP